LFNWLFTMYRGRIRFSVPMLWTVGFMVTFTIGGMTGVLMAVPPADFILHNSLFLIAHFHNVIIGSVVFGCLAAVTYWFPKAFGFTLDETLGKAAFWCWFVGFYLTFMPLYAVGFLGMTRRMQHYDNPEWTPYMYVAAVGVAVIFCGILFQIIQLVVSIRTRDRRRDLTGDPWNGRTLEWSTSSPPPAFNFAVLPEARVIDAWWVAKAKASAQANTLASASAAAAVSVPPPKLEAIEMPQNSPLGFLIAFFAVAGGFGMIWHMYWLGIFSLLAIIALIVVLTWGEDDEITLPPEVVARRMRAATSHTATA
jgi:cytochrome o ubiquinol oxidase subunit 1